MPVGSSGNALGGIFEEIAAQLTNQYRLVSTSQAFGPTKVAISVEVNGATASTSQNLRMPPAPAPIDTGVDPAPNPDRNSQSEPAPSRIGTLVELTVWQQNTAFYLGIALATAGLIGVLLTVRGLRVKPRSTLIFGGRKLATGSRTVAVSSLADRAIELAERRS